MTDKNLKYIRMIKYLAGRNQVCITSSDGYVVRFGAMNIVNYLKKKNEPDYKLHLDKAIFQINFTSEFNVSITSFNTKTPGNTVAIFYDFDSSIWNLDDCVEITYLAIEKLFCQVAQDDKELLAKVNEKLNNIKNDLFHSALEEEPHKL